MDHSSERILIGLGVYLGLLVICLTVYRLRTMIRQWKEGKAHCPHGIKGGLARGRCSTCVNEQVERNRLAEEIRKEEEGRRLIRKNAEQLRQNEAQRMTRLYMGRIDYLRTIEPREFEIVVCQLFEKLGYFVNMTPASNDRGKDAIMYLEGYKYLLECKKYGDGKLVGRPELMKFFAAMHEEGAKGGFVVTTGKFAYDGQRLCQRKRDQTA